MGTPGYFLIKTYACALALNYILNYDENDATPTARVWFVGGGAGKGRKKVKTI